MREPNEFIKTGPNEYRGKDGTYYNWEKIGSSNYGLVPKDKFVQLIEVPKRPEVEVIEFKT